MFQCRARYRVFGGDNVRFWHDSWLGGMPLKIQFHTLYDICNDPNVIVREAWDGNEWCVSFRRSLHGELVEDWENLKGLWERFNLI